jgi:predicted Zn-dependent protease
VLYGWKYLNLLYVDPANKHDITIIKEDEKGLVESLGAA